MRLGIPREVKPFENRVAMTPQGTRRLVEAGCEVWIESGAGARSAFSDADYRRAGARIRSKTRDVWSSDLVLKVKEPQPQEYRFFRRGLVLFTFLHLAAHPGLAKELNRKKVKAVAYELVRDEAGGFPILAPMSEIAGCLAALMGANFLRRDLGGKGTLLPAIGTGGTGHVTILGAGHVGANALRIAHGLGATVTVFDHDPRKLEVIARTYAERLQVLSDASDLPEILRRTDLLIGAVLVPGQAAPKVVSRRMVKDMEKGSVIVDVAIDQGGCVETSRPTTIRSPVRTQYGVLHCGVTNLPSLVPRTATEALARATLPYVLELAKSGGFSFSPRVGFYSAGY